MGVPASDTEIHPDRQTLDQAAPGDWFEAVTRVLAKTPNPEDQLLNVCGLTASRVERDVRPCVEVDKTFPSTSPSARWPNWIIVDLDLAAAPSALSSPLPAERPQLYGDGHSGERVVEALMKRFGG